MKENIILDRSRVVTLDYSRCIQDISEIVSILTAIVKTSVSKSK